MKELAVCRLLGRCLIAPTPHAERLADPGLPWDRLIGAANRTYLTPALYAALRDAGLLARLPRDVLRYLAVIAERNDLRNARLRTQLFELVGALNHQGVVPVLLKGAAGLFSEHPERYAASRMVTDLDLLVGAEKVHAALAVLATLGYRPIEGRATGRHALGDFVRDIDVGAVDLHVHLLDQPHLIPVSEAIARADEREANGVRARMLSPNDRVLHLLLHDLIQDQGIHDGRLNLRHLHELAVLIASAPVDWDAVATHLARYRLGSLLPLAALAVRALFGTPVPRGIKATLAARLLLGRSLLQMRYPRLMRCGEIFGNAHRSLAWYRHADREGRMPRLRRAVDYLRVHRIRTAGRVLHVLFAHRT